MPAQREAKLCPPVGAWNTHVHVFDNARFPFKPERQYTPESVLLEEVAVNSICQNAVLVQASFEDGMHGILENLRQARLRYSDRQFRGEVIWDLEHDSADDATLDEMHRLGVRCLRLHGEFGNGPGNDVEWAAATLRSLCLVAQRRGWAVAAQLPLSAWLALGPHVSPDPSTTLISEVDALRDQRTPIIAEHFGAPPTLPLDQTQLAQFEDFITLLHTSKRIFVKMSAIYRRVGPGESIDAMKLLIATLSANAPHAILYGSDFPCVDVSIKSLHPTERLHIDLEREALFMKSTMSEDTWNRMLIGNPSALFG